MVKAGTLFSVALGRDAMLLGLTWVAGSVDAVSYLGLGQVFTAMMTGNMVLLGLALAQGEVLAALRSILALIGFATGAFVSAIIVERESIPTDWPPPVTGALAVEAVVLGIFSATYYFSGIPRGAGDTYFLIVLLAFAMGIQSAAVRRLRAPGIATTYITGTITSLMVDLVGWLRWIGAPPPVENPGDRATAGTSPSIPWEQRVGLLAAVVSLYCLGALSGGILETHSSSPLVSLLPTIVLTVVVLNASIRQRYQQRRSTQFQILN
jgi:uncharacterized membrane protein YoaK (UPF0700 family)